MKEKWYGIITVHFVAIFIIAALVFGLWLGMWGLLVAIGLTGIYIAISLVEVPANPPHCALLTFFGKRLDISFKEGWKIIPPPLFDLIKIKTEKTNKDLPQKVRTPDKAEVEMKIAITFRADVDHLKEFIDSGKEEGINNIFSDIIEQETREWAASDAKGPKTWEQAYEMGDDLIKNLIEKILAAGAELGGKTIEEVTKKMRVGNGEIHIPSLGIILMRLNVGNVKVLGAIADAAEKNAKEEREKLAEQTELKGEIAFAKEIVSESGGKIEFDEAIRMVRDYKAVREGKGFVLSGEAFKGKGGIESTILAGIAAALAGKGGKS